MGMKSIQDKPLSGNTMEFVLHYWPGVLSCCDQLFTTCRKFSKHLAATHYPPKGLPRLAVVDEAELATATEESSVPDSQPDTAAEGSSLSLGLTPQSQRNGSTTIEPPTSRNGMLYLLILVLSFRFYLNSFVFNDDRLIITEFCDKLPEFFASADDRFDSRRISPTPR